MFGCIVKAASSLLTLCARFEIQGGAEVLGMGDVVGNFKYVMETIVKGSQRSMLQFGTRVKLQSLHKDIRDPIDDESAKMAVILSTIEAIDHNESLSHVRIYPIFGCS